MTWIKICGITNVEDALTAVDAGADAVGFVFYDKSPRRIEPGTAGEVTARIPSAVEKVGVFVNQTEETICAVADEAGLTAVQLHGDTYDPQVANLVAVRLPHSKIMVAVSMHHTNPEAQAMKWQPNLVHAFLLDSGNSSGYGGTGKTFEWATRRPSVAVISEMGRIVVAGGLVPGNVGEAIRILKPWGVDVASGVEAAPGKKDPNKIRAFVDAVRQVEKQDLN